MTYFKAILLVGVVCIVDISAKYVPFLDQAFLFDYNRPWETSPVPTTEQCETIHLKWGRSGTNVPNPKTPNPTAPYFMQVYASTFITPFIIPLGSGLQFDWQVPFGPGTQYQICMFDSTGLTGGCQSIYTVIPNHNNTNPSCQNVTAPPLLDVLATVPTGNMSQYGFIDQCTDLTVAPKSGKPPFILTVAPALHPPYNITSNSMNPINWTVTLPWAFPFFLSLSSSDGQAWAYGPMHAGGFGPTDCLAPGTIPQKAARKVAVGAGIGSLIAGIALGCLFSFLFLTLQRRKQQQPIRLASPGVIPPPQYENDHLPIPHPPSPVSHTRNPLFRIPESFNVGPSRGIRIEPYTLSQTVISSEAKITPSNTQTGDSGPSVRPNRRDTPSEMGQSTTRTSVTVESPPSYVQTPN